MDNANHGDITRELIRIRAGDDAASENLYRLVYGTLLEMAQFHLSREGGQITLNRTDLVHESYLKLIKTDDVDWQDRRHFFRTASRAMRRILVDHARRKKSEKRGGGAPHVTLDDETLLIEKQADELIRIDQALDHLNGYSERLAEVVQLRFFGGFAIREIAEITGASHSTVNRDWVKARGWLYNWLEKNQQ